MEDDRLTFDIPKATEGPGLACSEKLRVEAGDRAGTLAFRDTSETEISGMNISAQTEHPSSMEARDIPHDHGRHGLWRWKTSELHLGGVDGISRTCTIDFSTSSRPMWCSFVVCGEDIKSRWQVIPGFHHAVLDPRPPHVRHHGSLNLP